MLGGRSVRPSTSCTNAPRRARCATHHARAARRAPRASSATTAASVLRAATPKRSPQYPARQRAEMRTPRHAPAAPLPPRARRVPPPPLSTALCRPRAPARSNARVRAPPPFSAEHCNPARRRAAARAAMPHCGTAPHARHLHLASSSPKRPPGEIPGGTESIFFIKQKRTA